MNCRKRALPDRNILRQNRLPLSQHTIERGKLFKDMKDATKKKNNIGTEGEKKIGHRKGRVKAESKKSKRFVREEKT